MGLFMYAIVDIETTGSLMGKSGIMDIAVVLYDGKNIEGKFETLINPKAKIPWYVARLTGINKAMVSAAPPFDEIAENIFNLLKGRIFVAHNAAFDFPYVQRALKASGYDLHANVLCTLQLSKRAFPNFPKHGLDTLCKLLNINNHNRHRAAGDALATTELLDIILKNNGENLIQSMMQHW